MTKWIETTGKTEDAAVAAALAQLGLDRDDVGVEVICRPKTGFLGIGSVPAKVRVSYEAPDEPEAAPVVEKPAPAPAVEKPAAPVEAAKPAEPAAPVEKSPAPAPAKPAPIAQPGQAGQAAVTFLTGLLQHMGAQAVPQVTSESDGAVEIELTGEHLGMLIGRRGETLDAIQQLTNYTVNRGQSKRTRIHIDAENYRARREESLQRLAVKVAGKVVKYRKNVMLESMNAYERHVIHTALQDTPHVTTYSTGSEPNRRIVVAYVRDGE